MTQNAWNTPELTTNGQLLIAQNTGRPAAAVPTAGSANVTITPGAGSLTITTNTNATDWVKISESTASSSASISFTGLSSTYRVYRIVMSNVQGAVDGGYLQIRTSTNNGSSYDSGASDYQWSYLLNGWNGINQNVDTADSIIQVTNSNMGSGSNEKLAGEIRLYSPSSTTYTFFTWEVFYPDSNSASRYTVMGNGYRQSAADVDAIQFIQSNGNLSTGTFTLYGMTA